MEQPTLFPKPQTEQAHAIVASASSKESASNEESKSDEGEAKKDAAKDLLLAMREIKTGEESLRPTCTKEEIAEALRVAQYPYIATELRRIGILAGIIIIILIVLALVLS